MPLPRAKDVPLTAGVSGLVFVVALFSLGSPLVELILFATWGLIYVIESLARRFARRPLIAAPPVDPRPAQRSAGPRRDATDDART